MELKNFFAQDGQGSVIPGAMAYLYLPGTTTLATGLKDKDGAALANPMTATGQGLLQFAAPDGEYDFRVVGAGRDLTIRVRFADASAVTASANAAAASAADAAASAAAASATVSKPAWSEKNNGFPDPFFRYMDLARGYWLGRHRWWMNADTFTRGGGFALAAGTLYRGNKIQVTSTGAELQGPSVLLDEMGAAAGDTITVYVLATVSAGVLNLPGYFSSNIIGGIVGGQKGSLNDTGGGNLGVTATPRWLRFQEVVPAGVTRFSIAPYVSSGGSAEVHAIWAFKGAASTGPDHPVVIEDALTPVRAALLDNAALWRGKRSIWPDPFFRTFVYPDDAFNGGATWLPANSAATWASWAKITNPFYTGFALRKTGISNLSGPRINLSDWGIAAGDTVSLAAEVAGVAGQTTTLNVYCRCYDAANNATTTQLTLSDTDNSTTRKVPAGARRVVTATFTIPANTAYIWVYPANLAASDVGDLVALWGIKGTASELPLVPPLNDDPKVLDTYSGIATFGSRIATLEGTTSYAFFLRTSVSYSALSSVIGVTGAFAFARALTFSGFGARFTPAGVSFNAIRLAAIARTATTEASKWSTLNIVVRTGTNSQNAGSTVLAVGSVRVNPNADTLSNVIIPLKDPSTGAFKTLSDADFSGGEYGIMVYALNSSGVPAACGECRGTVSNFQGNSYYVTSGNARTDAWADYTGDAQQGFEHLLLTSPAEALVNYPTTGFVGDLQNELGATIPAPEVIVPPVIYGVQGRECNLYFDNLFLADAAAYNIDFNSVGAVGNHQDERWTWTPAGALTTGDATLTVHDKRTGTQLVSKTIAQRAAASTAGSGSTKKVCFIGDSLVNAGTITQTLLDIAGSDVMGVTLIGTRGSGSNKHEGRGGYTVNDYATAGRTYYSFTVSGVTTPPAINSTEYTHNGSTYRVQEVYLTGGAGTIVCSVVSGGAPLSSGTLTKSNGGTGDATIAFSASAAVSGNPFWKSGAVNFAQYLTDNSLAVPDWALIQLGTNDDFSATSDAAASSIADTALSALDTLIASIKAAGASTKVGLVLPPPPSSSQDAFGNNYTTGQPRWRVKRNYLIWVRQMIAKYAGQEANRIYLVPSNVNLDTVNNYPTDAAAPVNSRNSAVTKVRQNNSVHPATSGYQQIADAVWAFLKFNA